MLFFQIKTSSLRNTCLIVIDLKQINLSGYQTELSIQIIKEDTQQLDRGVFHPKTKQTSNDLLRR